ncbi:hypothetical protein AB0O90_09285 [Microbacterium testaceum]|uniref:hypothetical protein n=1 Tax=Microbacterium testaceum TaxID=2033 RepID=UPI00343B00FE
MTTDARKARGRPLKAVLVLGIFAVLLLAAVAVFLIPQWDNIGIEGRECTVTGAQAASSGGGRSPTLPIVRIETSDCGALAWQEGVTFDNNAEVAETFTPGVYVIRMGWFSRVVMPLLPDGLPTVKSYEKEG